MKGDNRLAPRHRCRFRAQVRFAGKNYEGQIIDVSATGMRISVDRLAGMAAGLKVEVFSEEIGAVTGVVQWQRSGSFGVRLELSSNTRAKLEAVWKNYITAASGPGRATIQP